MPEAIKHILKKICPLWVHDAINRYRSAPKIVRNWNIFALRQAVRPWWRLNCYVTTMSGSRFYLGSEIIDDWILEHVSRSLVPVYFPNIMNPRATEFLLLEVGAHHGFVTVEMLRRYPKSRIIAVEPNPTAVKMLKRNLSANHLLDRVEIVEAGIGSGSQKGFLTFSKDGSWGDAITNQKSGSPGIMVPLVTLASILKGRSPDVIKSNAEGAEYILIPQMLMLGLRPKFIILMPHASAGSIEDLAALLRNTGYAITDIGTGDAESPHWHCVLQ